MTGMATCVCGAVVVKRHLGRHKRGGRCGRPAPGPLTEHCSFCQRPSIKAIFDRLRAGDTVDAAAMSLQVTVRYVQESRIRGRSLGCLPKSTPEERKAEDRTRALQLYGERTCSECTTAFVPRLNTPEQNTCNKRCQEKRKVRLKREALGLPAKAPVMGSPERFEEEMKPQRLVLKDAARQAQSVRLITGEESHALWLRVLEIRQQEAA